VSLLGSPLHQARAIAACHPHAVRFDARAQLAARRSSRKAMSAARRRGIGGRVAHGRAETLVLARICAIIRTKRLSMMNWAPCQLVRPWPEDDSVAVGGRLVPAHPDRGGEASKDRE